MGYEYTSRVKWVKREGVCPEIMIDFAEFKVLRSIVSVVL